MLLDDAIQLETGDLIEWETAPDSRGYHLRCTGFVGVAGVFFGLLDVRVRTKFACHHEHPELGRDLPVQPRERAAVPFEDARRHIPG